jgi:hypothetical protein
MKYNIESDSDEEIVPPAFPLGDMDFEEAIFGDPSHQAVTAEQYLSSGMLNLLQNKLF